MKNIKLFVWVFLVAVILPMNSIQSNERKLSLDEAPTGFDNQTNGFTTQAQYELDLQTFAEQEEIADGLGPLFNAQSCHACHQNPIVGGISQVTELRAGRYDGRSFIEQTGGSLINDRAIDPSIQERVLGSSEIRTFRTSLNTLGDGYVECIDDRTLVNIANNQPDSMRGQIIRVPILEAPGTFQVGRFGWKNQHASLLSFSADAYLNEMGITSPMQPKENTSNGQPVDNFDQVNDPEDDGEDLEVFARFMRSTKAPPQDTALAKTPDAQAGSNLFNSIGCAVCHVRSIGTAPPETVINGGKFKVPAALGNKLIHPFSDFLLHDVGTGDGIVQNGGPSTRNKLRTPPLWGLRARARLMHDGESLTRNDAILRHDGEASSVVNRYRSLSNNQKNQLIAFLNSL